MTIYIIAILNEIMDFLGNHYQGIIALCALFITLWQLKVSRRHNRLSVRPFLTDHVETHNQNDKDRIYKIRNLTLLNNGSGIAIINTFEVYYKGTKIEFNETSDLSNRLQNEIKKELGDTKYKFEIPHIRILRKGYAIAEKEKLLLLQIKKTSIRTEENVFKSMDKVLDKFEIRINYKSIYDEYFRYQSH